MSVVFHNNINIIPELFHRFHISIFVINYLVDFEISALITMKAMDGFQNNIKHSSLTYYNNHIIDFHKFYSYSINLLSIKSKSGCVF